MKRYLPSLPAAGIFLLLIAAAFRLSAGEPPRQEYYELRIYRLENAEQEQRLDRFLKEAYLPALHRAGIPQAGVFKPIERGEELSVYVLIPYQDLRQLESLPEKLARDGKFQTGGKDYLETAHDQPVYKRFEKIVLKAFDGMPQMALPKLDAPKSERVYELRSYEGPSERLSQNKIQMFNKGDEIGIFQRLGFNAVFYADVLAGSHMPNLMYMTTFSSRESRDQHWKAFFSDPAWKKLSSLEQYQHNVSHSDVLLLRPAAYSDI